MRSIVFAISAIAIPLPVGFASAAPGTPACLQTLGYMAGPLVPDAGTAKAIFLAIERAIFPVQTPAGDSPVVATNDGDHWSVFRYAEPAALPDGSIVVTAGGGHLEMDIDKCSAAVSRVALSR